MYKTQTRPPEVEGDTTMLGVGMEKACSNDATTTVTFTTPNTAVGMHGVFAIFSINTEWTVILITHIVKAFILRLVEAANEWVMTNTAMGNVWATIPDIMDDGEGKALNEQDITVTPCSPQPGRYRPSGRFHQLWMRLFNCGDAMYRIVVFLTLSMKVASGASDSSKMDKATKDFLFVAVEAIVGTGVIYAVFRFIVHRLTSHIDARREEDLENADIEASGSGDSGDTSDELADDISGDSKQGDEAETPSASVTELPRMQSLRLEVLYYPI